jgi:tetratricopeptide (TPR) repeat protein
MARRFATRLQPGTELPVHVRLSPRTHPRSSLIYFCSQPQRIWLLTGLVASLLVSVIAFTVWRISNSPARLIEQAKVSSRHHRWHEALRYWRAVNNTKDARSETYLEEAKVCLALGYAHQAEGNLRRAAFTDRTNTEAWRLLLEILRVEERIVEAQELAWNAYSQLDNQSRLSLLRELTLGSLGELPDELARATLQRWVDADQADIDARAALFERIATQPRASDPNRPALIAEIERMVGEYPEHAGARAVLISALADSGESKRGRAVLNQWPEFHDARYWRLVGRWELEYDHHPDRAVAALRKTLIDLPQDWRTWYRLARAYHVMGQNRESTQAAEKVRHIREALDPLVLRPRLDSAFDHLDDPASLYDLAGICEQVGLSRLGAAWRLAAKHAPSSRKSSRP